MGFYTEAQDKKIIKDAESRHKAIHLSTPDIKKQIEAVQALLKSYNVLRMTNIEHQTTKGIIIRINAMHEPLKALTETLKPFLGDDKLEV